MFSCVSISAFIGPWQLSGGQEQKQPPRHSHRGIPSSFVSSSASTHSEPVWAVDHSKLLLSTSAVKDVNNTSIKSAMFVQPDNPAPPQQQQQQQQQQVILDLPQSPKQRQKAFSSTVVGFVKAGDGESALQLYGKAAEFGCMISENVFNAVLSVCDGDKASKPTTLPDVSPPKPVLSSCVAWCAFLVLVRWCCPTNRSGTTLTIWNISIEGGGGGGVVKLCGTIYAQCASAVVAPLH